MFKLKTKKHTTTAEIPHHRKAFVMWFSKIMFRVCGFSILIRTVKFKTKFLISFFFYN